MNLSLLTNSDQEIRLKDFSSFNQQVSVYAAHTNLRCVKSSAEIRRIMYFDGTIEEFEAIVNQNKLLLYSVAYAVAGNVEVDDIVQETFIYAYYHYGKLKNREKLSGWLCAIARNKAYDCVKRIRRLGYVSMEVLGETEVDISSDNTPELLMLQSESRAKLLTEINSLSEKYRETVLLYYFADMSIKEISELLLVPEGTIKFRLSDARKKLKKEIKGMFGEERANIVNNNIFERIKEETSKAEKALKVRDTKSASKICDKILQEIENLSPKTTEELSILYRLYQIKVDSIIFAEGRSIAEKYIKKAVEIAEASKDCIWISEAYTFYATQLSNMDCKEKATKYYRMALEKAEETGDSGIIAEKLYWNGINAYENKTDKYGLDYFERVLAMKEELFADGKHDLRNKDSYALSYSAYTALTRCGDKINKLVGFQSTAPSIAKSEEGLYLASEQGLSDGGSYCSDLFYYISIIAPFLSESIKEGYTFEKNTFSFSHRPVLTRYEVISMNEKVTVPAGSFEQCLHTRYTSIVEENDCERNKKNKGVTDVWYAPEVGVVCMTFVPIQGDKLVRMKLDSYKVEVSSEVGILERYMPLSIGNQWSYVAYDANNRPLSDEYEYENLFEVVCKRKFDNAAVIAQSGWGVKKSN